MDRWTAVTVALVALVWSGCTAPPPQAGPDPAAGPTEAGIEYHKVPEGSYVLGVIEDDRTLVLGNLREPTLSFLDLESRTLDQQTLEIVPRVALPLGEALQTQKRKASSSTDDAIAIFGFGIAGGQEHVTSSFYVLRGRELSHLQLAEPLRVRHGVVWPLGGALVLGDQELQTLAFVRAHGILRELEDRGSTAGGYGVRVGRRVLQAEPYHFELVSSRQLAVSYWDLRHIDLFDLKDSEGDDRLKVPSASGRCSLFAPLRSSRFAHLDGWGHTLNLFTLFVTRGGRATADFSGSTETGYGSVMKQACGRVYGEPFAITVSADRTVWLGHGGQLRGFRLGEEGGGFQPTEEFTPRIGEIRRLRFFAGDTRLAISAPSDGIVAVVDVGSWLGD